VVHDVGGRPQLKSNWTKAVTSKRFRVCSRLLLETVCRFAPLITIEGVLTIAMNFLFKAGKIWNAACHTVDTSTTSSANSFFFYIKCCFILAQREPVSVQFPLQHKVLIIHFRNRLWRVSSDDRFSGDRILIRWRALILNRVAQDVEQLDHLWFVSRIQSKVMVIFASQSGPYVDSYWVFTQHWRMFVPFFLLKLIWWLCSALSHLVFWYN